MRYPIIGLVVNFVLTVLIEGGILLALRKRGLLVSLKTALLTNLISYIIVAWPLEEWVGPDSFTAVNLSR